jgi:hypothetical protein
MGTSSKSIHRALLDVAEIQGGCFTAKQALSAGYADSVHNYHVNNGDWIKEGRGVYRLSELQMPDWPELAVWSLWSRGRDDVAQGIYCMETALAIHGLIKREDEIMHMAVPTSFRRNSEIPQQLKLYKEDIPARDIERKPGFLVTTLERTVRDIRDKCTHPKILRIIEAAMLSKPTPGPEIGRELDKTVDNPTVFKVKEYSGWDYWDRPAAVAGAASGSNTYNDIINAGED